MPSPDCSPGAGDYFRLTEGGTLPYRTSYAAVTGTLTRVP
jgi:hypothetical protein